MAILHIITAPHPLLHEVSAAVGDGEFGPSLQQRMDDMTETMYAAPGIGLAAVQVANDIVKAIRNYRWDGKMFGRKGLDMIQKDEE